MEKTKVESREYVDYADLGPRYLAWAAALLALTVGAERRGPAEAAVTWGAPAFLWALPGVLVLAALLLWTSFLWRRRLARQVDPLLWQRLTGGGDRAGRRWREALLLGGLTLSLLAAARPQFGSRIVQVKRSGVDVIVALDTSASMDAADVVPSRIARSRREIVDLLDRLRGDRIGIVVFEGEAYLLCPLTLDYARPASSWTRPRRACCRRRGATWPRPSGWDWKSFPKDGNRSRAIVVFSDGESFDGDVAAAAREARQADVRVYCVGVGTPSGQPIPVRDDSGNITGYKKDRGGQVVLSRLDEASLRDLAENSGGRYYPATLAGGEIESIYKSLADLEQSELRAGLRTRHEERFQIFAALAALCVVAGLAWPTSRKREEWHGRI